MQARRIRAVCAPPPPLLPRPGAFTAEQHICGKMYVVIKYIALAASLLSTTTLAAQSGAPASQTPMTPNPWVALMSKAAGARSGIRRPCAAAFTVGSHRRSRGVRFTCKHGHRARTAVAGHGRLCRALDDQRSLCDARRDRHRGKRVDQRPPGSSAAGPRSGTRREAKRSETEGLHRVSAPRRTRPAARKHAAFL